MKNFITKLFQMFNQNFAKLSVFTLLFFASSNLLTIEAHSTHQQISLIENDTEKMAVIPDPTGGNKAIIQLYAESNEANIVIFNATGIVVFEESFTVEKKQENSINLDLSTFKSGTYYIVHDESKDSATYSVK